MCKVGRPSSSLTLITDHGSQASKAALSRTWMSNRSVGELALRPLYGIGSRFSRFSPAGQSRSGISAQLLRKGQTHCMQMYARRIRGHNSSYIELLSTQTSHEVSRPSQLKVLGWLHRPGVGPLALRMALWSSIKLVELDIAEQNPTHLRRCGRAIKDHKPLVVLVHNLTNIDMM